MRQARHILLLGAAVAGGTCGPEEPASDRESLADGFCASVRQAIAERAPSPASEREAGGGPGVVVTGSSALGSMSPFGPRDFLTSQHQESLLLMALLRMDDRMRPAPHLARSWEFAPDSSHLTFHLRDDVYWHDGRPTTAEDVRFTYRRMMDPEAGYAGREAWSRYDRSPTGVEVLDPHTVRFRIEQPHAELLLPWVDFVVVPGHLLADVEPADLARHPFGTECPVGNGPFIFDGSDMTTWSFRSNPHHPEAVGGSPAVARYTYRHISESSTRLAELLTGRVHVYLDVPPEHAGHVEGADHLRLLHYPGRDYVFVAWNARVEKLADPDVRRALTLATNRREIVDAVLGGYARVAPASVPPFHWAYDPSLEPLDHDPERAGALLGRAGWRDRDRDGVRENEAGEPLTLTLKYHPSNTVRATIAELMQAHLSRVGIAVELEAVELATLIDDVTSPRRAFEGVVFGWNLGYQLDERMLFHSDSYHEQYALSGTRSPVLDRMLDSLADMPLSREQASALWARYQRAIQEEQPYTFFYFRDRMNGVSTDLENVRMDVRGALYNVREWRMATER